MAGEEKKGLPPAAMRESILGRMNRAFQDIVDVRHNRQETSEPSIAEVMERLRQIEERLDDIECRLG